jgi:hypothetical protein
MSADHLGRMIGRSRDAVRMVRRFVHDWHRGGNVSGLSGIMLAFLERHRGRVVCAQCPERL